MSSPPQSPGKICKHRCKDKQSCAHECCKITEDLDFYALGSPSFEYDDDAVSLAIATTLDSDPIRHGPERDANAVDGSELPVMLHHLDGAEEAMGLPEILALTLQYLPPGQLAVMQRVSKTWKNVIRHPTFKKARFEVADPRDIDWDPPEPSSPESVISDISGVFPVTPVPTIWRYYHDGLFRLENNDNLRLRHNPLLVGPNDPRRALFISQPPTTRILWFVLMYREEEMHIPEPQRRKYNPGGPNLLDVPTGVTYGDFVDDVQGSLFSDEVINVPLGWSYISIPEFAAPNPPILPWIGVWSARMRLAVFRDRFDRYREEMAEEEARLAGEEARLIEDVATASGRPPPIIDPSPSTEGSDFSIIDWEVYT